MSAAATTAFWHGQAHMPTVKNAERVIVRGEGAFVWDADGNRLLDATASLWYCNVGHGRREIAEAVFEQMTRIEAYATFQQYATPPPLELSERLAAIAPFPNAKVFLTSGGSDAIDVAAKLARRYWNAAGRPDKQTLVTRERAYHGLHGIGTSITGLDFNREGFGRLVPDTATYSGHASACAAAIANLDLLEHERLVDRVAELEPVLVSELESLAELPRVAEVRSGVGLLAGIELVDAALLPAVLEGCHERGVLTRLLAPSTLQVSPPFVATRRDLATMVSAFGEAIEAA